MSKLNKTLFFFLNSFSIFDSGIFWEEGSQDLQLLQAVHILAKAVCGFKKVQCRKFFFFYHFMIWKEIL